MVTLRNTLILIWFACCYCIGQAQPVHNRYGLELLPEHYSYRLKEEQKIRKLKIFDIDQAPADMFKPYTGTPGRIKKEDYDRCITKEYVYKCYPGYELKLQVDMPEGKGPFPYIVWIHGGGWHGGNFYGHKNMSTYLASNGIAGVRISYSLSSQGATFANTWKDIQDALSFIRDHAAEWHLSIADFGFAGHSAGGHLSAYAAMRTEGCKLLIGFNGIYDIEHVESGFVPDQSHQAYFGTSAEEKREASPVEFVSKKAPYCLLTYSTGDYLVDPKQVRRFESALIEKAIPYEIIEKDYYSHAGFIGGELYEPTLLKVLETARTYLKYTPVCDTPFVHPGMSQNQEDLDYMRKMVLEGRDPWKTAFKNLEKETAASFTPKPYTYISVGPYGANSVGGKEFSESATAVYNHALMWYITRDTVYARKAIEIMNAWSGTLRSFDANNAKLNVGLSGYFFMNAAEILRYSDSGWTGDEIRQFTRMVLTVFYPTIKDFFTEANGNWDGSIINTMMCIGVFVNDPAIFNRAMQRFCRGEGNSGITKYLYPSGQCQETTRDWDHVQLGIGEFAKAAQVAWTQGLDFYSMAGDRLAHGFEYTSRFMLGEPVETFGVLSHRRKEVFKDIYESICDYYRDVRGIDLPYTRQLIAKHTRPTSSIGLLTSLKAPSGLHPQASGRLDSLQVLLPSRTGALDTPTEKAPANAWVVRPGESVQQAIDACRGTDRWIVLEKGIHTLSTPLKVYSGLTLAGRGKETILFLAPELRTETIINGENDLHDVTFRDFLLEGAVKTIENEDPNHDRRTRSYMSAPSREGIILKADAQSEMKNLTFSHITVQNCTKNGIAVVGGRNIRILYCDLRDNGSSVVPGAGFHHNLYLSHISGCEVSDSRFDTSPWGSGIDLSFSHDVLIRGNEAARNRLSGIRCTESQNVVLTNNLTEGNDFEGITIDKQMDGCRNIQISGNTSRLNGLYD